ncbi:hypothetical protein ACFYXM_24630 [Streptomyces sp. NPDC002476]|uniref:hypothetical protein n=1 Tax=Streptomyces sp. NPDC002476 TaxID=3364648 RepID=UPI00367B08FA
MARCFGLGEGGGEGIEGRVVNDLFCVLRHTPMHAADVPLYGLPGRSALGESSQRFGCGLLARRMEVEQGDESGHR